MLILNNREAAATIAIIQNTGQQVAARAIIEAIIAITNIRYIFFIIVIIYC